MTNKLLTPRMMSIFVRSESYTINNKSKTMKIRILAILTFTLVQLNYDFVAGQQYGPALHDQLLEDSWKSSPIQRTALDSLRIWQEKVLLHTDKETFAPKDYLFFKAYVLTGPNQLRTSASTVLKVELLASDGTLVDSQYHKIVNGTTSGSFKVPKKTKSGTYYFRAYTRWMLNYGPENFAVKEILVANKNTTLSAPTIDLESVTVFPEGGTLIAGLENRVAISMKGHTNKSIVVEDGNGNQVATVQNYGKGLGTFLLKPDNGKKYTLKLQDGRILSLPQVGHTGYTLQISTIDDNKVVAKISATEDLKHQDIYLKGKVNGIDVFKSKVEFSTTASIEMDIPKSDLPNGILHVQLEDEFDQVWATRPLHIDHNELQFHVQKTSYGEGESLKIRVTDAQGIPQQTELSLAMVKKPAIWDAHLENTRNQRFINDLLVLTEQSPKEYALNQVTELPHEIKYTFQEGLEFYGRAFDLDAVPLSNTKIQIVVRGEVDALAQEVKTNDEGLFKLSGLQIAGEADMVFRRVAEGQRNKFVKVVPYQYETPPLQVNAKETAEKDNLNSKQFIPKRQVVGFETNKDTEQLITLEGVTLVGEKLQVRRTPAIYNIEPSRVVHQNPERPKTIPQLFLNIPGVQVVNLGNLNPSLSIPKNFGSGPILWVVDGIPLSQAPVEDGTTPLADIMSIVPFVDVDRIEILFGAQASFFGSRAAGGAILVYTRNGSDEEYLNRKKAQLTFEGYHNSLPFYAYQEQSNGQRNREGNPTLYWNPRLMTNENGEVEIKLPKVKDDAIQVDVRAITPGGKSGSLKRIL